MLDWSVLLLCFASLPLRGSFNSALHSFELVEFCYRSVSRPASERGRDIQRQSKLSRATDNVRRSWSHDCAAVWQLGVGCGSVAAVRRGRHTEIEGIEQQRIASVNMPMYVPRPFRS